MTYKKTFKSYSLILKQVNPEAANMITDPVFQKEITTLMIQTVITIICVYLLIHSLIYICRYFDKKFADNYIRFYAWTASVLMILTGLIWISSPYLAIFLIPGTILLFNALGFKYVDQMKEV